MQTRSQTLCSDLLPKSTHSPLETQLHFIALEIATYTYVYKTKIIVIFMKTKVNHVVYLKNINDQ